MFLKSENTTLISPKQKSIGSLHSKQITEIPHITAYTVNQRTQHTPNIHVKIYLLSDQPIG